MITATPSAGRREPSRDGLYELLPAYLRYRDQSEPLDSPLRALMAVLERQYTALDRDIGGLYDDWFIETCQDWIAPYLADLLGVRGLDRPEAWVPGQRTRIANALAYRRLKGTTAVLERVARDVTGWACVASPFFERVSWNQSLEHVRSDKGRTVDVRDRAGLARFGGPFDTIARRPQISGSLGLEPCRSPRDGYNLPNLGLYFYRLQSYPARRRTARKISPGCYTFHALGIDQSLFAQHRSPGELTDSISERELPGPLTREILAEELNQRRSGVTPTTEHLGERAAVEVFDPRTGRPVPWRLIEIADLSSWRRPESAAKSAFTGPPGQEAADPVIVALDPELGRLAFAADYPVSGEVEVSYHYPACGDLAGGPYVRPAPASKDSARQVSVGGPSTGRADGASHFASLEDALAERPMNAASAHIQIVDSATYGGWSHLDLEIPLRPGTTLEIGVAPGQTPSFIGNLRLLLEPGREPSRLMLEGLSIGGKIVVAAAGEAGEHKCELELRDCTLLAPDAALGVVTAGGAGGASGAIGGIELEPSTAGSCDLAVRIQSSIVGPISIPSGCGHLEVSDSVVDGGSGPAIFGSAGSVHPEQAGCSAALTRSTIFGRISVAQFVAEDTLFAEPVTVAARHLGRLDHCYVPAGSAVGRLEKCQPAEGVALVPVFTSRAYGRAGYAQLAGRCPREIRTGASNGSEIGAFSTLGNPFREVNLTGILEEYMPWGVEPRVFHVT